MCQRNGGRIGLLISNIILMLCAFLLLAIGVVMVIGRSTYGPLLTHFEEDLKAAADDIGKTNLDVSKLDILFITRPIGIAFIVFGALFLVVAILGCIAGCGQYYVFVMVYAGFLSVIFFIQIVVLICCYVDRAPFDSTAKKHLKESLLDWTGIDGEDSTSLGWNAIMSMYDCCGVDDYKDAAASSKWKKTLNGAAVPNLETPLICCSDPAGQAPNCAKSTPNNYPTETFYNRGCYTRIWGEILSSSAMITILMAFFVIIQFLCLFFATWIFCGRKSKTEGKVGDYPLY